MEPKNSAWTIGRKTAITIIIATATVMAGATRVTWKASAWAKGIESRLTAIDQRLADQTTVSMELIGVSSRLAVCEARIEDLRHPRRSDAE